MRITSLLPALSLSHALGGCAHEEERPSTHHTTSTSTSTSTSTPVGSTTTSSGSSTWSSWDTGSLVCQPVDVPRDSCARTPSSGSPPPGQVVCQSHDECGPEEFCGLGYCRDASAEDVLVCIDEVSFVGNITGDDTPPDLFAVMAGGVGDASGLIVTDVVEDVCAPIWHECDVWRASALSQLDVSLWRREPENHEIATGVASTGFFFSTARTMINADCVAIPMVAYGGDQVNSCTAVVSVHYPP